jgi:hypothetical protein
MSWQSQFDAKGPNWDGNAAAVNEEKRLQKLLEELRKKNVEPSIDSSVLATLDREMEALNEKEKNLLHQLERCDSEQEKVRIENNILLVRKSFWEIKERYVTLRQSRI